MNKKSMLLHEPKVLKVEPDEIELATIYIKNLKKDINKKLADVGMSLSMLVDNSELEKNMSTILSTGLLVRHVPYNFHDIIYIDLVR